MKRYIKTIAIVTALAFAPVVQAQDVTSVDGFVAGPVTQSGTQSWRLMTHESTGITYLEFLALDNAPMREVINA